MIKWEARDEVNERGIEGSGSSQRDATKSRVKYSELTLLRLGELPPSLLWAQWLKG